MELTRVRHCSVCQGNCTVEAGYLQWTCHCGYQLRACSGCTKRRLRAKADEHRLESHTASPN